MKPSLVGRRPVGTTASEHERDDMTSETLTTPASDVIDGLLLDVDGRVIDRSRVVDALLDIRLAAGSDERLVAEVDAALGTVPGKTMVPTEWYREALCRLGALASAEVATV
jgi:hypothetical protein